MSASLVIVFLVASSEAHDPETVSATSVTREGLGPSAVVVVREVDIVPPDPDAMALATKLSADALVEIRWSGNDHSHVTVHVLVRRDARWEDRELDFAPTDAPSERGRTVGLAVIAMSPEAVPDLPPIASKPAAPPIVPPIVPTGHPELRPPQPSARIRAFLDSSLGVAGSGGGVAVSAYGVALGFGVLLDRLVLRAGAATRLGNLTSIGVSTSTTTLVAGVGIEGAPLGRQASLFRARLRVDALASRDSFSHNAVSIVTWSPGLSLATDAGYELGRGAAAMMGVGVEWIARRTTVYIDNVPAARPGALRVVFSAGLRLQF